MLCVFRLLISLLFLVLSGGAAALEVSLAGVLGKKAILIIDGKPPRTMSVGDESREGVRLISVDSERAIIEFAGSRQTLNVGAQGTIDPAVLNTATIYIDTTGHFLTDGRINGRRVHFLVDTGASVVVLGKAQARSLGIDTSQGTEAHTQTANGVAKAIFLTLDLVAVGNIELRNVQAAVLESDLPHALLGMSFLKQVDVEHFENRMTLKRRF